MWPIYFPRGVNVENHALLGGSTELRYKVEQKLAVYQENERHPLAEQMEKSVESVYQMPNKFLKAINPAEMTESVTRRAL